MNSHTIQFITFSTAGYGHVRVSALVNGDEIFFTTDDMRMTDAASDEDAWNHDQQRGRVECMLINIYEDMMMEQNPD